MLFQAILNAHFWNGNIRFLARDSAILILEIPCSAFLTVSHADWATDYSLGCPIFWMTRLLGGSSDCWIAYRLDRERFASQSRATTIESTRCVIVIGWNRWKIKSCQTLRTLRRFWIRLFSQTFIRADIFTTPREYNYDRL